MDLERRVLLVEDNEDLAENIEEILEDLGVSILRATNAAEAYALSQRGFALALVDVGLPGESGVEVLARLKETNPDAEVVLMTGDGRLDSAIDAVHHGAFAYLLKPFKPEGLQNLAERALAQVSLRQERTYLAKALSESEALYRGVLENVEALIVGLNGEGQIGFCNRFAASYIDDPEALYGRPFAELWSQEDPGLLQALRHALGGSRIRDKVTTLRRPDGTKATIRWTLTPVDDGSEDISLIAVGLDVTEQLELRQRSAKAEALAAVGTLTAGLAHEIRNPLNAASLQLQLMGRHASRMGEDAAAEKMLQRIDVVQTELGRLTLMLNDFLGLARPQDVDRERFPIAELLTEVCAFEGPLCEEDQVALGCDAPENLMVIGDRARLRQVLTNLLRNAREALDGPGSVELVAQLKDTRVEVQVIDDGPGLGEDAGDPFEPFFTTKAAGTGLGLSIVQKLIALHGGEISLRNRPEGGAVATFSLPLG